MKRLASNRSVPSRRERGAVTVEYVVLIATIGLVVMASLVVVGRELASDFARARDIVASPFP